MFLIYFIKPNFESAELLSAAQTSSFKKGVVDSAFLSMKSRKARIASSHIPINITINTLPINPNGVPDFQKLNKITKSRVLVKKGGRLTFPVIKMDQICWLSYRARRSG
jgi:hypothetical protein